MSAHFWITYALEIAKLAAIAAVVAGVLLAYPRTRRVLASTCVFAKRHAPKWAIWLMLAPIPGPFDELAAMAGLLWVFRSTRMRRLYFRYVTYSWR